MRMCRIFYTRLENDLKMLYKMLYIYRRRYMDYFIYLFILYIIIFFFLEVEVIQYGFGTT